MASPISGEAGFSSTCDPLPQVALGMTDKLYAEFSNEWRNAAWEEMSEKAIACQVVRRAVARGEIDLANAGIAVQVILARHESERSESSNVFARARETVKKSLPSCIAGTPAESIWLNSAATSLAMNSDLEAAIEQATEEVARYARRSIIEAQREDDRAEEAAFDALFPKREEGASNEFGHWERKYEVVQHSECYDDCITFAHHGTVTWESAGYSWTFQFAPGAKEKMRAIAEQARTREAEVRKWADPIYAYGKPIVDRKEAEHAAAEAKRMRDEEERIRNIRREVEANLPEGVRLGAGCVVYDPLHRESKYLFDQINRGFKTAEYLIREIQAWVDSIKEKHAQRERIKSLIPHVSAQLKHDGILIDTELDSDCLFIRRPDRSAICKFEPSSTDTADSFVKRFRQNYAKEIRDARRWKKLEKQLPQLAKTLDVPQGEIDIVYRKRGPAAVINTKHRKFPIYWDGMIFFWFFGGFKRLTTQEAKELVAR